MRLCDIVRKTVISSIAGGICYFGTVTDKLNMLYAQISQAPKIVFVSDRDGNKEIYSMNSDGTAQNRLTDEPSEDNYPVLSPNGLRIIFSSLREDPRGIHRLYTMSSNGLAQRRLFDRNSADTHPRWFPNGRQIVFQTFRDGNTEIYTADWNGENPVNLTNHPDDDNYPEISSDGRKIVYQSYRNGNWEVYVMDADGKNNKRLTFSPAKDMFPVWSPDGRSIAFISDRRGIENIYDVYVINADGTGEFNLTNSGDNNSPYWSPEGDKIAYISFINGQDVIIVDRAGANSFNVTNHPATDWVQGFLDNDTLLIASDRDGDFDLYRVRIDGTNLENLTNSPGNDYWAVLPAYFGALRIPFAGKKQTTWGTIKLNEHGY